VNKQRSQRFNMERELLRAPYWYNCCSWLIINESSKQCVLAVLGERQHFSRQVAEGFRRKLLSVKSRSNQPAFWTPCISQCYSAFFFRVPPDVI
jgi:hypothetical protein